MKKDIEWLKNKALISKETYMTMRDNFEPHSGSRRYYNGMLNSVSLTLHFINELDKPEVLSQEWIDNNSINASSDGVTEEYVYVDDLEKLIIPKQELPVIPQFVADYLEKAKKEIDLLRVFEIANGLNELDMWRKEYNWIRLYHLDFARAWLDSYKVEEEPLYYALLKGHELIIDRGCMTPKYWKLDTSNGRVFPSHIFTNRSIFLNEMTKEDWNGIGINDSNADFVKVDKENRGDNNG